MAGVRVPTIKQIVRTLGGAKTLQHARSQEDLLRHVRAGLPYGALEAVTVAYRLPLKYTSAILHIPERTLQRRKSSQRLRADESDRLYRLARIATLATEVLGSVEKARDWLARSNRALGGQAPIQVLDTDIGVRQVEDILGRVAHGVYG